VWLNEGVTTYVENRIMEQLRGREISDVQWYQTGGAIAEVIAESSPLSPRTRLAHSYGSDTDPEDIPADLAYDKGALFLRTLEQTYGRVTFDEFLRGWFDHHAFQSVNTRQFIAEATNALGTKVNLGAWLYGTGLPADAASTDSKRASELAREARDFAATGREPDPSQWTTLDWTVFLGELPTTTSRDRLLALDARFGLRATKNSEIAMHWLPRLVSADDRTAVPAVRQYLSTVGRRRNVSPVYEAMIASGPFWRNEAQQTFDEVRAKYHPITRESIARMLTR
jgi:hypothetical protein